MFGSVGIDRASGSRRRPAVTNQSALRDAVRVDACATGRRACSCPGCRRRRCRTGAALSTRDLVELGDRQVGLEVARSRRGRSSRRGRRRSRPGRWSVSSGSIQSAWLSTCLLLLAERCEGLAAVVGHLEEDVHRVDAVDVLRVGEDLLVVLRAGRRRSRCASPSSRRASVERKKPPRLARPPRRCA